ncbi:hypothetical protein A1Q2_01556 [Trichosporon asahii var. asahii CBS 8904]|uniref:Uncharacterized protein n=1 Tax=Trichosporon asahii var. asahii (strain CBS 8904) TaxID=1220162 RepID=K1VU93_TRIAC|nr:hypothetical protein A1Q2_01556 [Trichosporon asahii var. asahii CBS 8904]
MSGRDLFGRPLPTGSMSGGGSDPPRPPQQPRPPPSSQPSSRAMTALDASADARLGAFRQLMSLSSQQPTSSSPHASLLARILQICETLPPQAFSPSLINYVLFPLTSILRQSDPSALPDNFLETAYNLLAFIITRWRSASGGMDVKAWEQLWRFVVASASPRVGKDRRGEELSQEAATAALNVLIALLRDPTDEMKTKIQDPRGLLPTLFQSITLGVDLSNPAPPNTTLQRASVHLLQVALPYVTKSNILASLLPGVVSAMAKAIVGGVKGDIGLDMASVVQDVLVRTLNDADLRDSGVLAPQYDDLADLAGAWNAQQEKDLGVEDYEIDIDMTDEERAELAQSTGASGTSAKAGESIGGPSAGAPNPFPPLNAKYLQYTGAQLQATVPPILSTLAGHQSPDARAGAASLASALLLRCRASLPRLVPHTLSTLLLLSTDEFDAVRDAAETELLSLLGPEAPDLENALVELLSGAINALPRLIRAGDEKRVDETARLIIALAHTTARSENRFNPIAAFLGPSGHVERWAFALLECLEFGRPRGWSAQEGGAARTAALGWGGGLTSRSLPLLTEAPSAADASDTGADAASGAQEGSGRAQGGGVPPEASFPNLQLRYVPSPRIASRLESMLSSLGAAGGEPALHSVSYFVSFARGNAVAAPARSTSAVWVADNLLSGIASTSTGTKAPKAVRKAARDVARALVELDEAEDEAYEEDEQDRAHADGTVLVPERKSGLQELTTLLDRPMANQSASEETARLDRRSQRCLLTCFSLRSVSTSASILGASFKPLLLHTLYPLLAALSHPADLVRTFAEVALAKVAYESGYASAQNMVLANADYVVNCVSQRLTYHRLDSQAPLVLIAMIRLVGAEIVPLVHDIVDEVFDALDAFHGYAALASALLAVLNALVETMANDPQAMETEEGRKRKEEDKADTERFLRPPNPESDFAKFGDCTPAWVGKERSRRQPGRSRGRRGREGAAARRGSAPDRGEELGTAILSKATYYLSHSSPFLRARVLALIASCVAVLSGRPAALLPEIDKAWPTIMLRLTDPEPYVVVEAVSLLRSLCEYVPSYISKRLADAWPTLRRLLVAQMEQDRRNDLATRGVVGRVDKFSASHRLYAALLGVAQFMVAAVPVKEGVVWDVCVSFRPFLDVRAEAELQDGARELYSALNERDGDLTWTVLSASIGSLEGDRGTWDYLRDPKGDLRANAMAVLAS